MTINNLNETIEYGFKVNIQRYLEQGLDKSNIMTFTNIILSYYDFINAEINNTKLNDKKLLVLDNKNKENKW